MLILAILVILFGVLIAFPGLAAAKPRPVPAPQALLKARHACPDTATPVQCRAALRHAYASLEWAKHERTKRWQPNVEHAIQLACVSQPTLDCNWFRRMIWCESRRNPFDHNASSASGLAQFLDGTWSGNRFSHFSVYDPYANALGAAWYAVRVGYAPWYASKGCWS